MPLFILELHLHPFFTSPAGGGDWPTSRQGRFFAEKEPPVHCAGGWVTPTAGLDDFSNGRFLSYPPRISAPDRPAPTEEL